MSVRCEGLEPDVITYATLIEHLCTQGRPAEALAQWARMRAKALPPTLVIGHTLLHALEQAQMLDEALAVVQPLRLRLS